MRGLDGFRGLVRMRAGVGIRIRYLLARKGARTYCGLAFEVVFPIVRVDGNGRRYAEKQTAGKRRTRNDWSAVTEIKRNRYRIASHEPYVGGFFDVRRDSRPRRRR